MLGRIAGNSDMGLLLPLKIRVEESLKRSRVLRDGLVWFKILTSRFRPPATTREAVQRLRGLCQAARVATTPLMLARSEAGIARQMRAIRAPDIVWQDFLPDFGQDRIHKALVLKPWVSSKEKGVIFFSFDNQMARLLKARNLAELAERYSVVLAPQWSPPHSPTAYLFPRVFPDDIICLISGLGDLQSFPRMNERYRMVPLYASSWVDSRRFSPKPERTRDIDILMVANFAKFKRHHALFQALRDLPPMYRVVLIGQNEQGRTSHTILAEASAFGVRNRFTLEQNVAYDQMPEFFGRAKVSIVLSVREGSCVVVAESMFADTPVGIYRDAELGSRVFVNPQTGMFFEHRALAGQLQRFVDNASSYHPRRWMLDNGADCTASSRILNSALKREALEHGREWTQDIATLCWGPDPRYYEPHDADRMRSAYQELESRFDIRL